MTRKIHIHCTYCMTKGYFGRKLCKIYAQLINPSYDSSDYSHDKLRLYAYANKIEYILKFPYHLHRCLFNFV